MSLHVQSSGQGRDLVMLHGWGLHGGIFDQLAQRLSDRCHVHQIDLPGHGRSEAGPVGLTNWADAVIEVMPDKAVVMGWSLGGLVAQSLALRYPQRVTQLVLMGTSARLTRHREWPWGVSVNTLTNLVQSLKQDYVDTLQEFLMLQMLGQPGAAVLIRTLRNALLDCPPKKQGLMQGLDILRDTDLRDRLQDIRMPSLLIAGERDRLAHPDAMSRMQELMPDCEIWRVPRAAHAPFLSSEADLVKRLLNFMDC